MAKATSVLVPLIGLFFVLSCISAQTVHAQHSQIPAEDAYFTGITLYENGQFEEAIQSFNRFLDTDATDQFRLLSRYYIALSKAAIDPENTVLYFDEFTAQFPDARESAFLFIDLAHRYSYEGDLVKAVIFYEKALELPLDAETAPQVLYWTAETYVSKRDYEQAHFYYNRIVEEHSRSRFAPKALFSRGRLYLIQQEYDLATEMFEELRRGYPVADVTRRVGTALGEAYYRQERYEEAISALRSSLSQLDDQQQAKASLLIAESFNYLGDLDSATTWYRRYIRLVEGREEERLAHYGLGWVFHKQGVYHWAAESFGRAVTSTDELSRKAQYYKAINRKLSGRYDLALQEFEKFAQSFPRGMWAEQGRYEWAVTLFEIGDHVSAIETLLYIVRNLEPLENPGDVFTLLGEAYFANSEYTRAIESFQRAEQAGRITPEVQLQARFQRAWVMYRNRAYDQSQPIFESVYVQSPHSDIGGEALFWSADSFYNMQEFGPASARFARYISEFPSGEFVSAARYSLAWSYFMLGQFDQSIPQFKLFLQNFEEPELAIFPYDIDAKLRIADASFALRKYDDAINFYEQALAFSRSADYATYQIANSFYRDDRTFEAVRTFRQLINDFPESTFREQAQYSIGYIYLLSGNYSQAIAEFDRTLELFPRSRWAPRAQFNIGNAHFNAQEFDKAIAAYQRVLDRYPQSDLIIEAVNGIQFAQESAGMEDTSNEKLESFIASNPSAGSADQLRFRQSRALYETGDFEGAITALRNYIRITNNESMVPEAWFVIAESYLGLGDTDKAIEHYQKIAVEFPNSSRVPLAYRQLGRIKLEKRDYSGALQSFSRLNESSREMRFEALIGMGNASLGLNNADAARNSFDQAERNRPGTNLVRLGMGRVAFLRGNFEEAREQFKAVADASSDEAGAEAQYRLGLALQRLNSHIEAISAFGNVRTFFGAYREWVGEAMVGTVESHQRLGNRTDAEQLVRQIRQEFPGSSYLRRAEALLR
ncbi:MAG: tetratricopeptide repeat protein [Balneolales bacterium]|nr:tetratricopeptide repeat protein [Balneolales bacterium]